MDGGVEVGPLDALLQLADEQAGDPVATLGTVEGDAGHTAGDLVEEGLGSAHHTSVPGGISGRGEIRTPETGVARLPVFKTGAFNRSATLPGATEERLVHATPHDFYDPRVNVSAQLPSQVSAQLPSQASAHLPSQASAQLRSESRVGDSTESAIGEIVSHYQRGVRRIDLAAVEALWRASAPTRVPEHIVVVGTNGKTSTATYIARLLSGLGVKSGLYTSPHIASWSERVLIDGEPCGEEELLEALRRYDDLAQELAPAVREELRFFDLLTLVAEDLLARRGVEVGVFEAGIGGRLDATRILGPRVVALTSIGLDHQNLLGDTPREILLEKLAVAPAGATIVSAPLAEELASAQREWAADHDVTLAIADATPHRADAPSGLPAFQVQNMAVAEAATRHVLSRLALARTTSHSEAEGAHPPLEDEAALGRAARLVELQVLGRFHRGTVEGVPYLADTAHNVSAWSELLAETEARGERFVAVLALTEERDPKELAEAVKDATGIEAIVTTTTRIRPGHDASLLLAELQAGESTASAEDLPERAFAAGLGLARERGVSLLVTGSTYLVADFLAWLKGREG